MRGINNKPYVTLDQYVDIKGLLALKNQVIRSIAKSADEFKPASSGTNQNKLDNSLSDVFEIQRQLFIKHKGVPKNLEGLDLSQRLYAIKYMVPCSTMGNTLVLRGGVEPENYHLKGHNSAVKTFPASARFGALYDWIKKQNIFTEVGRVMFFLSNPYQSSPVHSDYPALVNKDIDRHHKDQFLWIRFDQRKEFFVYDEAQDKKHIIDGYVCYFNSTDYHGSEPGELHSFSLRLDGIFSKSFLDRVPDIKQYLES